MKEKYSNTEYKHDHLMVSTHDSSGMADVWLERGTSTFIEINQLLFDMMTNLKSLYFCSAYSADPMQYYIYFILIVYFLATGWDIWIFVASRLHPFIAIDEWKSEKWPRLLISELVWPRNSASSFGSWSITLVLPKNRAPGGDSQPR